MAAAPIAYLLRHIYSNIPIQILDAGFEPNKLQMSRDQAIISLVIQARVLMDTNLVAGRQTPILLQSDWIKETRDGLYDPISSSTYNACFFWVPPKWRENRNISAVIRVSDNNLSSLPTSNGSIGNFTNFGNTIPDLANAMVSSYTLAGAGYSPQASLEGNNLIKVYGNYPNSYFGGMVADVVLEFDSEFSNIGNAALYYLRDLALCATKAWLWTKLVVEIDAAQVTGGMQMGVFKDIIDSYANANEEYQDRLMDVSGASLMDENNLGEFLRMQL